MNDASRSSMVADTEASTTSVGLFLPIGNVWVPYIRNALSLAFQYVWTGRLAAASGRRSTASAAYPNTLQR